MSTLAFALAVAAIFAASDWWAVATSNVALERVFKPLTMFPLIALPLIASNTPADVRVLLVAGACLGLAGDVALLNDGEVAFLVGLGAFAIGHVLYAAAAASLAFSLVWSLIGVVVMVALLAYRFLPETLPGARRHGGAALAGAVVVYAFVITMMVVAAWGTQLWLAGVGATLFAVSDWVLGYQRFVAPLPGRRLSVHVPYHVGQALLIAAIATG